MSIAHHIPMILSALLAGASASAATPQQTVELVRTQTGIAHVTASDAYGLGFGQGYAQATDNLCVIARHVITVRGEKARFFGAEGQEAANVGSDFFARYYYAGAEERLKAVSGDAREILRGYAAGYNRALETLPAGVAAECRDAPWVRPITLADMFLVLEARNILSIGSWAGAAIVAATPPGAVKLGAAEIPVPDPYAREVGSNGWAFGRDATGDGSGLLVGNPHFFWTGENRFHQVHLRIPGKLDAMGAGLLALPGIQIGFNRDVAWTHTISYAGRGTFFELTLVPGKPTSYMVDGKARTMAARTVAIEVKRPDGGLDTRTHVFYETEFGPILVMPKLGLTWTANRAFAFGDALRGNVDQLSTWLAIARAGSVGEVRSAIAARTGTPWVNTLAADRKGDALYADMSRMPNVTDDLQARCAPSAEARASAAKADAVVLAGNARRCNWRRAPLVPGGALLPASQHPAVVRTDYLVNANDSYWLTNAANPMPRVPSIVGPREVAQGLRNRMELTEIAQRLAGTDGLPGNRIDRDTARAILFRNRNYAALLARGGIADVCARPGTVKLAATNVDLSEPCRVLLAWDGADQLASRGAILFRQIWPKIEAIPNIYAVPFDVGDPVNTPRDLAVDRPEVREAVRRAIAEGAAAMTDKGFAIDASVADAQSTPRLGGRIPIHGAPGAMGVLNAITSGPLDREGYTPFHGTSYLQFVSFDADGPVADGILTFDQSTDPASPYSKLQTEAFSRQQLFRLPFSDRAIKADPGYKRELLEIAGPGAR